MTTLIPVAIVRSPRTEATDDDWGDVVSQIELHEDFPPEALSGIEAFSHVEVVFHFDRVNEGEIQLGTRHPRSNSAWPKVGIFAQRGKNRPTPLSAFDQFRLMAPIVEMRGAAKTVDLYADLLVELDERVENGVGVIAQERKRLLWDNLPIWYKLDFLAEFLSERGIVLAASTYTAAWGELADMFDPEYPFESAARTYLHPILNRSTGDKLQKMLQVCEDYQLDGVILHSDRSCKPYSIGQIDQRDRLINTYGIPALLLEADHNDQRSFSQEQVTNRLEAFFEMLGV